MADFSITVSNQLYAFGPDSVTPSLWNVFQWGEPWAYTSLGFITETEKLVTNSLAPDSALSFDVAKQIDNTVTPTDDYAFDVDKSVTNSLAPSFETSNEELKNGAWNYVFRRPSTNAENRTTATFTTQANATTTWTSSTATSTSWS